MIIYKIQNLIDGKCYIGQSTRSFKERYRGNKWWVTTVNEYLKRAADKHGAENFDIEILVDNAESKDKLNELEVFYIKKYNSMSPNGYNLVPGGDSRLHCIETCDKMSIIRGGGKLHKLKAPNGEIVEFINVKRFSREHGLTARDVFDTLKGKIRYAKGWRLPETKIIEFKIKSPDGKIYLVVEGLVRKFCREHGLHHTSLLKVANKIHTHHKGWTLPDAVIEVFKFRDPNGNIHEVSKLNFSKFCKTFNLSRRSMHRLRRGEINQFEKWTKYNE